MRALGILMLLVTLVCHCNGARDIAPLVSAASIRKVQVGMTREEVVSLLGMPYEMRSGRRPDQSSWETWAYSRHMLLPYQYPMLWVHFDKSRVAQVVAKRYILWGFDFEPVYGVGYGPSWETPNFEYTF